MSWAWRRATWREEERDRVFFFMRMRFSLSLSLSLSRFFSFVSKRTCGCFPPSLASPQCKISSQLCNKEFHQKMKEKHTQEKESRDCTSPKAAVFKNTRNNDFPTQTKQKKPKHTIEVQTQQFSLFFKITEKREGGREGGRQRAAKTATRKMRSPREKQRQEKASSTSFSFLNPLFWGARRGAGG
jgi:hypothetical protein